MVGSVSETFRFFAARACSAVLERGSLGKRKKKKETFSCSCKASSYRGIATDIPAISAQAVVDGAPLMLLNLTGCIGQVSSGMSRVIGILARRHPGREPKSTSVRRERSRWTDGVRVEAEQRLSRESDASGDEGLFTAARGNRVAAAQGTTTNYAP